jgi:hypothetical protein
MYLSVWKSAFAKKISHGDRASVPWWREIARPLLDHSRGRTIRLPLSFQQRNVTVWLIWIGESNSLL